METRTYAEEAFKIFGLHQYQGRILHEVDKGQLIFNAMVAFMKKRTLLMIKFDLDLRKNY